MRVFEDEFDGVEKGYTLHSDYLIIFLPSFLQASGTFTDNHSTLGTLFGRRGGDVTFCSKPFSNLILDDIHTHSKQTLEDINYLPAILSGDRVLIHRMYASLFPYIRRMVLDHVGTDDDAKDVFQDAVIVIYEMAQKPGFQLTSKFNTLFYGVCRNLWMSRRQKKSSSEVTIPEHAQYIPDDSLEIDLLQVERGKLFYSALRQLGEDCQKLLQLFFQKRSMDEIAREMGFASEGYARRRKSQCKDRLVELIKNDAVFPELQSA